MDAITAVTAAATVIGFLSIWVKMGTEKGKNEKSMETFGQRIEKHEAALTELKNTTHSIQLDIAKNIGKIEAKLEYIKESIAAQKGGRRAEEK